VQSDSRTEWIAQRIARVEDVGVARHFKGNGTICVRDSSVTNAGLASICLMCRMSESAAKIKLFFLPSIA
jgi:hypothetical protein